MENKNWRERLNPFDGELQMMVESLTGKPCEHWDRKNIHKTIDGKNVYARCLALIYSRWPTDKCSMWEKWQKN